MRVSCPKAGSSLLPADCDESLLDETADAELTEEILELECAIELELGALLDASADEELALLDEGLASALLLVERLLEIKEFVDDEASEELPGLELDDTPGRELALMDETDSCAALLL